MNDSIGLDKDEYRLFVADALKNCIVVGGYCKTACIFCSCRAQNAAGLRNWTKYISMEDMISVLNFINPNETIFFGEGVNFLSCEPFQHPFYLDLLDKLNEYYPNSNKMTTTICKNIKSEDYDRINNSGLEIVAGINTFDSEQRSKIMRSKDDIEGVKNFLKECKNRVVKTSFLYTGNLDVLKRDLETIYSIDNSYENKNIMLRLTDYSKFHNKETKELYAYSKLTWRDAIRYFDKNVKYPMYWLRSLSDFPNDVKMRKELLYTEYMANIHTARINFTYKINKIINHFNNNGLNLQNSAFMLSESVYNYFKEKFPSYNAIKVKNETFGGSYMSSKLLTIEDIKLAIKNSDRKYDNYIFNKEAFRNNNKDITGRLILNEKLPYNLYLG